MEQLMTKPHTIPKAYNLNEQYEKVQGVPKVTDDR